MADHDEEDTKTAASTGDPMESALADVLSVAPKYVVRHMEQDKAVVPGSAYNAKISMVNGETCPSLEQPERKFVFVVAHLDGTPPWQFKLLSALKAQALTLSPSEMATGAYEVPVQAWSEVDLAHQVFTLLEVGPGAYFVLHWDPVKEETGHVLELRSTAPHSLVACPNDGRAVADRLFRFHRVGRQAVDGAPELVYARGTGSPLVDLALRTAEDGDPLPRGGWRETAYSAHFKGGVLTALLRTMDGRRVHAFARDINPNFWLENCDGKFVVFRHGAFETGQVTDALPRGTWRETARNVSFAFGVLAAELRTRDGRWVHASIHGVGPLYDLTNIDGTFQAATPRLPSGFWRSVAKDVSFSFGVLTARLRTDDGRWVPAYARDVTAEDTLDAVDGVFSGTHVSGGGGGGGSERWPSAAAVPDPDFRQFVQGIVRHCQREPIQFFGDKLLLAVQGARAADTHWVFFSRTNAHEPRVRNDEFAVKVVSYAISKNSQYGFDRTMQVSPRIVADWFDQHSHSVGGDLLFEYAAQQCVVGRGLLDGSHVAAYAELMAPREHEHRFHFLTPFLIHLEDNFLPAKALLTLFQRMDRGGAHFKRVVAVWSQHPQWEQLRDFASYPWLHNTAVDFEYLQPRFNQVSGGVKAACASTAGKTYYGERVIQWQHSADGPQKYGIHVVCRPDKLPQSGGGSSCMVAGTPILMADGTSKPVEAVVEGDRLLGPAGTVAVASAERVVMPGLEAVYSINDDEPFMTFEHAVQSHRGWVSLNPAVSLELVPHASVAKLEVGDVVVRARVGPDGTVSYENVRVDRINTRHFARRGLAAVVGVSDEEDVKHQEAEEEEQEGPVGFHLHLQSGEVFYAHGYQCLLMYPQVTMQFLAANMQTHMDEAEQAAFRDQLRGIAPLLAKAFGQTSSPDVFRLMVDQVLAHPMAVARGHSRHSTTPAGEWRHRPGSVCVRDLVVPCLRVVPHGEDAPTLPHLPAIAIAHGHVFIDGVPVDTHSPDGHRHLAWHRTLPSGEQEHGAVRLLAHGLAGDGVVSYGGGAPLSFDLLAKVDFTTEYQDHGEAGHPWKPWLVFEMGFKKEANGVKRPYGRVFEAEDPDTDALGFTGVVFHSDDDGRLTATVSLDVELGADWVEADLTFAADYRTFSGKVYPFDENGDEYRGAAEPLRGEFRDDARKALAGMFARLADRHAAADATQVVRRGMFAAQFAAPTPGLEVAMAQISASERLSVNDLYTLPPPDQKNVHDVAFGKLKGLMLLALSRGDAADQQWLKWFGETAPVVPGETLSHEDAALLDQRDIRDFLVDKFAVAYLTHAFAKSTEPNIAHAFQAVPHLEQRLDYFWKGDGTTSLCKDKGYAALTAALQASAFRELAPGLDKYLRDDPAGWAKRLFDYCENKATLAGLAIHNTKDGRKHITNLTSILHVLDPRDRVQVASASDGEPRMVSYATALWRDVVDLRLKKVYKYIKADNGDDAVRFLTEFFKELLKTFISGDSEWETNIRDEALKDFNEMEREFGTDGVNATVEHLGGIIADFVKIISNTKGPFARRIRIWASKNRALSNRLPGLGRMLALGLYGLGFFLTVQGFLQWGQLTPARRAQLVINTVDLAANIFNSAVAWQAARTLAKADSPTTAQRTAIKIIDEQVEGCELIRYADESCEIALPEAAGDEPSLLRSGEAVGEAMRGADAGTEVETAATRWTRIAQISGELAQAMNVVALGAACVVSGIQVANDFATDQPTAVKVLDIMTTVADGIAFVGGGVALVLGAEVMAAIPVIGEIAAVVGIVLAIVSLFIHRRPPPTPQETFVRNHCVPFANRLDVPPQGWES